MYEHIIGSYPTNNNVDRPNFHNRIFFLKVSYKNI